METHRKIDLILVEKLAAEGLSDEQIARCIGIPVSTWEYNKAKDPALQAAVKKGKMAPNIMVEQSLLRNALGFKSVKTKYVWIQNPQDPTKSIKVPKEEVIEHVAGNVSAQTFWLTNNWPEKYKNRYEVNNTFAGMVKASANMDPTKEKE